MATTTININMDKKCSKCGQPGATDGGRCLKCVADEVIAAKNPVMRTIKKAKLTSLSGKGLYLEYTDISDGELLTHTVESTREVHADLFNAFQSLRAHLIMMCELKDTLLCENIDLDSIPEDVAFVMELEKYAVTSITLGGEDEHVGVTITGRKNLRNKRVLNLNTPFTKFHDENNQYVFAMHLARAVDRLVSECDLYIGGKSAPKAQQEMKFPEEEHTEAAA